jgi:hypothetical protein
MNEDLPLICAESSGVPILLCPAELAGYWEGIHEPRNGRVIEATFNLNGPDGVHIDYDRACDAAHDYVNTIQIGPGNALVLGEEIPSMYWIQSENFDGGYLAISLCSADEEEPDYQTLTRSLPKDLFLSTACIIMCSDEGFLLFPSTQAPMDNGHFEFVKINCPAGTYGAALGFYETSDTSIRIIKIQRQI